MNREEESGHVDYSRENLEAEELRLQDRLLNGDYYLGEGDGSTILGRLGEIGIILARKDAPPKRKE